MSHLSFLAIVVAVVLRACESTLLLRDTKHSANGRRLNANFTLWKRKNEASGPAVSALLSKAQCCTRNVVTTDAGQGILVLVELPMM